MHIYILKFSEWIYKRPENLFQKGPLNKYFRLCRTKDKNEGFYVDIYIVREETFSQNFGGQNSNFYFGLQNLNVMQFSCAMEYSSFFEFLNHLNIYKPSLTYGPHKNKW